MVFPLGPLVNAAAGIAGGLLGLALGARLPERMRTIVFQGLGLCTMVIGIGLNLLNLTRISLTNMLPALPVAAVLASIFLEGV